MFPNIQNTSIAPCKKCHDRAPLNLAFSMAFQPIVDARTNSIFAYEALVRGKDGSGAGQILSKVTQDNRYQFDQACRFQALSLAASLEPVMNFVPIESKV